MFDQTNQTEKMVILRDLISKLSSKMNPKYLKFLRDRFEKGLTGKEMAILHKKSHTNIEVTLFNSKKAARRILAGFGFNKNDFIELLGGKETYHEQR